MHYIQNALAYALKRKVAFLRNCVLPGLDIAEAKHEAQCEILYDLILLDIAEAKH